MKKLRKTYGILIVVLFCLPELTLGAVITPCLTPQNKLTQNVSIELTDVIYRCGPNGIITPVTIQLQTTDKETREDALFNACVYYAEHDEQLISYLTTTTNLSTISFVKSRGRGLHFDFITRVPVKRVFKKFPNLPPFYRLLKIHTIHSNYLRDSRAESLLRPFIGGNETVYQGSHTIDTVGFIGYTTWIGTVAKRGFIFRCGFAGYGITTIS